MGEISSLLQVWPAVRPTNARSAEVWAVAAYEKWSATGISLNPNGMHALQGYWNSFNVVATVTPLPDVYLHRSHWSICIILES